MDDAGTCMIPAAFYLKHTVDERSPFYSADNPMSVKLHHMLRVFLTVVGVEPSTLHQTGGFSTWSADDFVFNRKFSDMERGDEIHALDFKQLNAHEAVAVGGGVQAVVAAPRG